MIGADPGDDEATRERKALLVLISMLMLPISVLLGALSLAFGPPVGIDVGTRRGSPTAQPGGRTFTSDMASADG